MAGVSEATVSRALSGKGKVSARSREKVQAAARELGYVMSYHASSLASGRNRNIGIVLPSVNRWYFSSVLEGATAGLLKRGYDLTLYNFRGGQHRESVLTDFLMRRRLDAVIAVSLALSSTELEQLLAVGRPVVGVGGPLPEVPTISIDEFGIAVLATEHLIGLGHRRIAHLGGIDESGPDFFPMSTSRRAGYLDAMGRAGHPVRAGWNLSADYTVAGGYRQAKSVLANPADRPSAIFSSSDEMAIGAIMAARDLGLRVPDDLSVIGIDGNELGEVFGLTTIAQFPQEQGRLAVERLLAQLEGGPEHVEPADELFKTEFLVRSSTAVAAPQWQRD